MTGSMDDLDLEAMPIVALEIGAIDARSDSPPYGDGVLRATRLLP